MSFRIAEKQAKKSTFLKHRVGAVIVKGGRVLSTGYNEIRYSGVLDQTTVHAEESAILKLLKDGYQKHLVGSTLYVTRFTRAGALGCSLPCSRCSDLIKSVGISLVHYLDLDGLPRTVKI
jgi:cytidine deaminase